MSARRAAQLLGLPLYAIPQLVAINILQPQPSELSMFLRGDHRVGAEDVEKIADWLAALPLVPPSREWISLSEAFTAVGGRDKPWAAVIKAALSRELPGGLVFAASSHHERGTLSMARLAAREFVAGGPGSRSPLTVLYESSGSSAPPTMTPGEVMDYLNCSAVEISWLREAYVARQLRRALAGTDFTVHPQGGRLYCLEETETGVGRFMTKPDILLKRSLASRSRHCCKALATPPRYVRNS